MRIIHKDLKEGKIKLLTENLNDLWHLQHIIEPGDIVTSITWRRLKTETDKVRADRQEKERIKLSIEVIKTEFQKFSNQLRVLGEIIEGTDLGEHHTIKIDNNTKFTLRKKWKTDQLERLKEARKASRRPVVLLIALDDENATFGLVRQYGLEEIGEIGSNISGKMYKSDKESSEREYYLKICKFIKNLVEEKEIPSIIVAGPGFAKKEVYSTIKEKYPDLTQKIHLGNTSNTGSSGLNEIIRRGIVKRVSEEDRTSLETELISEMMEEISKNGKATYGLEEVKNAVSAGAVEKLLVSDKTLRNERGTIEPIMEKARNTGSEIFVISSEHESGNQLARIGGVGAILRYRIS